MTTIKHELTPKKQQLFNITAFTIDCYYRQSLSHFGFTGVIVASNTHFSTPVKLTESIFIMINAFLIVIFNYLLGDTKVNSRF